MSKRGSDAEPEGPASKMRREDVDDGGGGRTGRVRKKSAKVLEMEEFEQVEKTHQGGKKTKTPKAGPAAAQRTTSEDEEAPTPAVAATPKTKAKTPKSQPSLVASLMQAPISVTPASSKSSKGKLSSTEILAAVIKREVREGSEEESDTVVSPTPAVKAEQPQSVIKYLLSSPSSGSKTSAASSDTGTELVGASGKKSGSKKSKPAPEKSSSKSGKSKSAKQKLELGGDNGGVEGQGSRLKMRISASSDPQSAQVTLNPEEAPAKVKKGSKKVKIASPPLDTPEFAPCEKSEPEEPGSPSSKKAAKKLSKKKEKLIQDAIIAAQQVHSFDATVEPETPESSKPVKKKKKVKIADQLSSPSELAEADPYDDDAGEESNLVIAETEKKKKKTLTKKKSSIKDKGASAESKTEDDKMDKKLSKRAPTAYMLFCNTHRPAIVAENPGIEFAGISRKLGEMWQTLSTKQKLQWRRKAQRRMKKGSNLISTGKSGKEAAAQGSGLALIQPAVTTTPAAPSSSAAVRYINFTNRSPVETPQSPTKSNFSIEPVDVAAHLKLLGESLSIIGMRLQEHKGMIAVQGSLSVLLDSLLCACGPLLCLSQQVPYMDGCDPTVHAQTLDSVAYVMPGL